jgi:hypothetical protein
MTFAFFLNRFVEQPVRLPGPRIAQPGRSGSLVFVEQVLLPRRDAHPVS